MQTSYSHGLEATYDHTETENYVCLCATNAAYKTVLFDSK